MSKRETKLLLEDIIESIDKIERYTKNITFEEFFKDEKTIDAVIRNFEVIGEAANQIPKTDKLKFHQVEWRKVIGLRNRIIHEYFGIDLNIVWQIKEMYLPSLRQLLNELSNDFNNKSSIVEK